MKQRLLQLDNISFNLPDGRVLFKHLNHTFNSRITGIVGANGVGKSLLVQLLTSQQLSSSGIVRCERQVYVVPQLLEPEHYPTVAALWQGLTISWLRWGVSLKVSSMMKIMRWPRISGIVQGV